MNCIWCDAEIIPEITWVNLFVLEKARLLCPECEASMEKIPGSRCERCSRKSTDRICSDCQWWEEQGERNSVVFNHSIFTYNSMMKEMIVKWKYRGDYYIGEAFRETFRSAYYEKFTFLKKDVVAVPIPLSESRIQERAFNQAKMLADFLPIETKEILSRVHGEKQSKKNRKERLFTENPFFITETLNKTVILVDDIYTTGTTLRHAAKLLKENGSPKVYALTLIRG